MRTEGIEEVSNTDIFNDVDDDTVLILDVLGSVELECELPPGEVRQVMARDTGDVLRHAGGDVTAGRGRGLLHRRPLIGHVNHLLRLQQGHAGPGLHAGPDLELHELHELLPVKPALPGVRPRGAFIKQSS